MQQLQIQADMFELYRLLNLSAFVSIVFIAKIYLDSKDIIGIMQINVNFLLLFKAYLGFPLYFFFLLKPSPEKPSNNDYPLPWIHSRSVFPHASAWEKLSGNGWEVSFKNLSPLELIDS